MVLLNYNYKGGVFSKALQEVVYAGRLLYLYFLYHDV